MDSVPGEIRAIFRRAEVFGHAYGIAAIAITVYVLDPERRKSVPRLIANCLAAGLAADVFKVMFWRTRPRGFELLPKDDSTWVGSIWTTDNWTWDILFDSSRHSFPSAHTATAVAMAITLSKLYPAGRNWFALLAALCAANRIDGGAHYVSDVCWGAALSILLMTGMYRSRHVNQFFARWEHVDDEQTVLPLNVHRKSA
jgi:membrane-associated phospholipid phosphatase